MYKIFARAVGATPVKVTETNRCVDPQVILDAISSKTRLIYIANPGNPTGTMIGGDALRHLAAGLPPQVVLVLDGAYAEFAPGYDGGVSVVDTHDNVVMTGRFPSSTALAVCGSGGAMRRGRSLMYCPHSGTI